MAVYNKYHKEVYQVSYNGGASWEDVSPAQYRKGTLMQLNSPDCTPVPPVPGQPFTIVPTEKDLSVLVWGDCYRTCDSIYVYYSYDQGQNWTKVLTDGSWFNVNVGQKISFKVEDNSGNGSSGIAVRNQDNSDTVVGKFYVEGNLGTMKHVGYGEGFQKGQGYFSGMTSLTSAENLVIPDSYCGKYMFKGCTSLITPPQLPATTLTSNCYTGMFSGCTSLTSAPQLPATGLTMACYNYMFEGCTSLVAAPALPATTLATNCYCGMFKGCTSLTSVPQLPATTLANGCYESMFEGCSSITSVPSNYLPATTLAYGCYLQMLKGTSITTAPNLPATTLAEECYYNMFNDCTALTTAPALNATTLASKCYYGMFAGCTSLTTAPDLPAATLPSSGYSYMFYNCSSLNYIKCLATDISAYNCTNMWVYGVASSGTFIKHCDANWSWGYNGIPNNWAVNCEGGTPPTGYTAQYLTLEALENGSFSFSGTSSSTVDNSSIQYSLNSGSSWNTLTRGNSVSVTSGQKVMWKSTTLEPIPSAPNVDMGIGRFVSTGRFNAEGNVMSLYYGDNFSTEKTIYFQYAFENLFKGCSGLTSAENLILPATTLGYCCYRHMFHNCTSLTTAPELPATNLTDGNYCYEMMFYNCSSLRAAPQLPATTLSNGCYGWMFYNCSSLTVAPTLPATTLTSGCYRNMFWNCTSITTLPNNYLHATTLASTCYHCMFGGCTGLTNVPTLPATTMESWCYCQLFAGCTSLTSVPSNYLPATTLANHCYVEMFNGCTGLTTAPDLPATTLIKECYEYMFYNCSNLNYVKCLATDISAENCTTNWLSGVASSGTFYKNSSMSNWPRTVNGIPSGWSVYNA